MACNDCASNRKYLVDILRAGGRTSDGMGGFKRGFTRVKTVRCAAKFSAVREKESGRILQGGGNIEVSLHRNISIELGDRVRVSGLEYRPVGFTPPGRGERYAKWYGTLVEDGLTDE